MRGLIERFPVGNDANFYISSGFVSSNGDICFNCIKDMFDYLCREGGKMMNIFLYFRITGKSGRLKTLRRFMKYLKGYEGV